MSSLEVCPLFSESTRDGQKFVQNHEVQTSVFEHLRKNIIATRKHL